MSKKQEQEFIVSDRRRFGSEGERTDVAMKKKRNRQRLHPQHRQRHQRT